MGERGAYPVTAYFRTNCPLVSASFGVIVLMFLCQVKRSNRAKDPRPAVKSICCAAGHGLATASRAAGVLSSTQTTPSSASS